MTSARDEQRARLAARQAAFLAALVTDGTAPDGFDAERVTAAALSLAQKRGRTVARLWPEIASTLGEDYRQRFLEYARTSPLPELGGTLADAHLFLRWCDVRQPLSDELRLWLLATELSHRIVARGLVKRRWPAIRVMRLLESRQWHFAMSCPGMWTVRFRVW